MTALRTHAPGKVNLCLFLGPTRADGLHDLVSVVEPVTLADVLTLEARESAEDPPPVAAASGVAGPVQDEVICPGVTGDNLAARALRAFRERAGWDAAPQRLRIDKHVPVAAGMGGGSGDAAAALRLAAHAAAADPAAATTAAGTPGPVHPAAAEAATIARELAPGLGADVPVQLLARPALVEGAGERVTALGRPLAAHDLVVVPSRHHLSTPAVYAEADRLGLPRDPAGLHERRAALLATLERGDLLAAGAGLLHNDLAPAARALCPGVAEALRALERTRPVAALVAGSGPTTFAVYTDPARARHAAAAIPGAILTAPAPPEVTAVHLAAPAA